MNIVTQIAGRWFGRFAAAWLCILGSGLAGCAVQRRYDGVENCTDSLLAGYLAAHAAEIRASAAVGGTEETWGRGNARGSAGNERALYKPSAGRPDGAAGDGRTLLVGWGGRSADAPIALHLPAMHEPQEPASQPTGTLPLPEDYWKANVWQQADGEFKSLLTHDFWRGFKTSFWDLPNALLLTATMGASISIRESGVDDAIRRRTHGQYELGDFDEPIQLLGHPGTHFAATGVLWLTSALTKDVKQHEVAKTLTQALAVNGATTLVLKVATNTRAPDNGEYAWPSGHTSSAFTVAAVLNEYYGPWVGVPSLALAGLVGYQRLDSRVHDFSDVVFGAVLGYVVGTSIARDNKAEFPELFGMKVVPYCDPETGTTGLALMKQW